MSVKSKLYVGVIVCFISIIGIGVFFSITLKKQMETSEWVLHTRDVIKLAQDVKHKVIRMESNRLAYRTTVSERFLLSQDSLSKLNDRTVDDLRRLVSDNDSQLKLLDSVSASIYSLQTFWHTLTPLSIEKGIEFDELRRRTLREESLIGDFYSLVNRFVENEEKLLSGRLAASKKMIDRVSFLIYLTSAIVCFAFGYLTFLVQKEFIGRVKLQKRLKGKLKEMEDLNKSMQKSNWVLTGVGKINDAKRNMNQIKDLVESCLSALTDYLESPIAVWYLYNEKDGCLVPISNRGVLEKDLKTFKLGDGIIGQTTAQKQVKVYDIPEDYFYVEGSFGAVGFKKALVIPLYYLDELLGVIELGQLRPIGDAEMEFLHIVQQNISSGIYSVRKSEQMQDFLDQLNQQKEQLELQKSELILKNEEVKRQANDLMVSEEELRVQEEELRQINYELSTQNESLEQTRSELSKQKEALEVSSKYKSEFLANMSHELRTPLNSVLILSKLLSENQSGNLTDKQKDYSKIIYKSGSDLLNLINDILDLSKIEAGKVDFDYTSVETALMANDMQELFKAVAEDKKIDFIISDLAKKTFYADRQRFGQILKNLLANAFKFTPSGGKVRLKIEEDNTTDQLVFVVQDTGIGIPREKQEAIFEAFQQADGSTNRVFGGTGLGLSISRELAHRMGGKITVESTVGQGSKFSVWIPKGNSLAVSKLETESDDRHVYPETDLLKSSEQSPSFLDPNQIAKMVIEQQQVEDDRSLVGPGDNVILIVEDDVSFATIMRDFVRSNGFSAIIALAGDEGIYCARKYKPKAVILDMNLPVVHGKQVLEIIREDENMFQVPIHVVSSEENMGIDARQITGYTIKPVTIEAVNQIFETLVQSMDNTKNGVLLMGPNKERREVLKGLINKLLVIPCLEVQDMTSLNKLAASNRYCCLIYNVEGHLGYYWDELVKVKEILVSNHIELIIYLEKELNKSDELKLKKISSIIINHSEQAHERIIDELNLYFKHNAPVGDKKEIGSPEPIPIAEQSNDRPESDFEADFLHGKAILLVDDDMRNIFALSALLENKRIPVITAENGVEAMEILVEKGEQIALILMDIMMPIMDGYETMRRIRSSEYAWNNIPIIALTAKAMPDDEKKCMEAGASDYVSKPVDTQKLISLLKIWVS